MADPSSKTTAKRAEPVECDDRVIGYTVRINVVEVEAVLLQPERRWDRYLGVFRRRSQGRRAIMVAYADRECARQ